MNLRPVTVAVLGLSTLMAAIWCNRSGTPDGSNEGRPNGPIDWNAVIEVATGEALAGPWRMNESRFHYVDDATVAFAPDGSIGVVWADNRRQDLFFRTYGVDGAPRSAVLNVSRSPSIFSWLPRLTMAPNGHVFVLWQEIVFSGGSHGGEAFFARSIDGGKSFEPPINLSNTPAGDGKGRLSKKLWDNGSLALQRRSNGDLLAAWTDYEGRLWLTRSTDDGRSFPPPHRIAGTTDRPARGPSLASGDEPVVAAWTVGEDPAADIHFAISNDGGATFGPTQIAHESGAHSDLPKIAVDGKGTLHLVYAEADGDSEHQVRYARKKINSERFDEARVLSGGEGATAPSLALDGADVAVVWGRLSDGQRQGLAYTISRDGGETFAAARPIPPTMEPNLGVNGSRQGRLMDRLALHESGHVAIAESRFRENERSRVRLLVGRIRDR